MYAYFPFMPAHYLDVLGRKAAKLGAKVKSQDKYLLIQKGLEKKS